MKSIKGLFTSLGYSRRFYKYYLSYMILLIIVVLILRGGVYSNFIKTLRQDIETSNISALMQMKSAMDMRVKEMEKISVNISLDNGLKPYMVMGSQNNSIEAINLLHKYKSGNEFIYDIGLYHKYQDNQKIYTTETVDNLDIYFKYIYNYEKWGKGDFLKLVDDGLSFPAMRPIELVRFGYGMSMGLATYIYPLPLNSSKPNTFVLFQIEEKTLKGMIKNVLNNYDGYVYILDEKNRPIVYLAEGGTDTEALNILSFLKVDSLKNAVNDVAINNINYSVVKLTSDYNRWSYITLIPTDQFMKKVYTRQNIFNYICLVALVSGILIAFLLSVGNYRPLRQLVDILSIKNSGKTAGIYGDEYSFISSTFDEVSKEKLGLIDQLKTQSDIMKDQFLLNLIKRKTDNTDELMNRAGAFQIMLDNPFFAVLIILMHVDESEKDSNNELKINIVNAIEELFAGIGNGYSVDLVDESGMALLLNLKAEYVKERHLSELAFKLKDYIKSNFNYTLTVSIGNVYEDICMIHQSYVEASRAAQYRLIKGNDSVIFFEDIKEAQNKEYKYPTDKENELIMALKQGNLRGVEDTIDGIRIFIESQVMSPESVQFIYFGMIKSVIRELEEMNIELPNSLIEEKDNLFINTSETMHKLINRMRRFCNGVCIYINNQKESKNFELRDKILNIINKSYSNNTLSLEIIADECGMSPSYISRFFKDQIGQPPMQYIDMLRMNRAKELLKNTSFPVKDILSKVGYIDESNFMRKFKKKEGITPIQFRVMSQGGTVKSEVTGEL